ncbi:MAG: response regulator transcription factor, partial [Aurantibacter sp.]
MARILIIEDDVAIRENTAELLQLEGYSVLTASNGKKGLEKIIRFVPDLILCDLLMPEMDGFAVLKYLGEHPDLKRIPFIFFSAKSEKVDVRSGLGAGADDYLTKPFELEDLLASIEKCLTK